MSAETWHTQGRRRRRDGRSKSQSGGGPGGDNLKGLAFWCDANTSDSISKKLGALVADGRAAKNVVEILKTARLGGKVLNSSQRSNLEGQLRRAGPWELGAGPASTGGKAVAPQRAAQSRAALARDPSNPSARPNRAGEPKSALEKQQNAVIAELKRKLAEAERQTAADPTSGAVDAAMAGEDAQTWSCANCSADHSGRSYRKPNCRICEVQRSAASAPAAIPVGRSSEEVEAERAKLVASKDQLAVVGRFFSAAQMTAALKNIETELRDLDSPPAEPAAKDPFVRMHEAKAAVDKAALYHARLHTRASSIEERIALMHADLVAVGAAIERADRANELAKAELAAAATATAALTTTSREPSPETGGDAVHLADAAQLADKAYMALLEEELAGGTFTGPELLQRISAKLATRARIPVPAVAAAPLAASQQARLHPPRGTPATAHGVHGGDAPRVGQRPSPKFISAESIAAASANILKSAERGRKEGRDHLLDAGRADADESGNATPV